MEYLIKGVIIGFSVAAPVGPIGVLCIKRTLSGGRLSGFMTGMGAVIADTLYGIIAGFGILAITNALLAMKFWMQLGGGVFLLYLGAKIFVDTPAEHEAKARGGTLWSDFFSTLLLTLTNPVTILSFLAVFAGMGLGASTDGINSLTLVIGVFVGSTLWWGFLSLGVGFFRENFDNAKLRLVNKFSGATVIVFGILALYTCLR